MGSWIARLRRKTSTTEVLECLEKDISSLERLKKTDIERQRRIVGSLIVYSVLIYISSAILLYFYFLPKLWLDRFFYCLPMILFPLLVWLLKRFLHWFYVKRIQRNDEELERLKEKKNQLLEDIKENYPYKKAKEILERFAAPVPPEHLPSSTKPSESEGLRHRSAGSQLSQSPPSQLTTAGTAPQPVEATPPGPQSSPAHFPPSIVRPPGPPLPRPILPRDRTLLDRLMEYLVGDGPQNRFALICAECQSHNGMALREEFEYIGFRCCYCHHMNEARKQRPRAPSLDEHDVPSVGDTEAAAGHAESVCETEATAAIDHASTQHVTADHLLDQ